jgi:ADP-ribosyl-[dinitrogen reductase] hydrolase
VVTTDLDLDRFRGAPVGLTVGDAVGAAVEFKRPGTFPPVTDRPFDLPPASFLR